MPKLGHLKYLLVIIDHLTHWVEAIPLPGATATNVIRVLLENIIPRFGSIENIDSNNGSHFTANILKGLKKALEIKWEYHTTWHPSSSGRVERINQTLKNQLTKLVLETRLPWIKCLPIALLRIRMPSRKDIGLSPMKCFMGFLTLVLLLIYLPLKPETIASKIIYLDCPLLYFVLGKKDC
jgi:hypothetical protein